MKVAYVTEYDAQDISQWSGTGYYIAQALKGQSLTVDCYGPLEDKLIGRVVRKYKRHFYELFHKRYLRDPEPFILKDYAKQISQKLQNSQPNVIFSATTNPIAYLECEQPVVFWADATFANILGFYPHYSNLCEETVRNWHLMERLAIEKCQLAIYSSEWAAQTAIEYYEADPSKVKVVPFGANITDNRTLDEISSFIQARPVKKCKLLFLAVDWYRKGGDIAFKVAQALNQSGLETELTVVGCQPTLEEPFPNFVKSLGFISKSTDEGKSKIQRLLAESHFLILPSRADCTPIVLSEANSLGVPCIVQNVGGIPTIIKNDVNGRLFELDAEISEYCQYISEIFSDYSRYQQLAMSAFEQYQTRLNWSTAGKTIKDLLMNL